MFATIAPHHSGKVGQPIGELVIMATVKEENIASVGVDICHRILYQNLCFNGIFIKSWPTHHTVFGHITVPLSGAYSTTYGKFLLLSLLKVCLSSCKTTSV